MRFTGFLTQGKLYQLYVSSHIFFHPSELMADSNQEGIPNSMLEAMSSGLPVVATYHGGIPEAVENERHGPARAGERPRRRCVTTHDAPDSQIPGRSWARMGRDAADFITENFEQQAQIRHSGGTISQSVLESRVPPPATASASV